MVNYVEGKDYNFIVVDNSFGVKILDGEFLGVEYSYKDVSVSEHSDDADPELYPAVLSFHYDIKFHAEFADDELRTIEFKTVVGDIFMSIIENSLEK